MHVCVSVSLSVCLSVHSFLLLHACIHVHTNMLTAAQKTRSQLHAIRQIPNEAVEGLKDIIVDILTSSLLIFAI